MDFDGEGTEEEQQLPLMEAGDVDIVMHRDAHFAGRFDLMLQYYMRGGKGIQAAFNFERMQTLALMERELKQNLAALLFTDGDYEKVAASQEEYKKLRNLAGDGSPSKSYAHLIADLILSEEEEPQKEMQAIVTSGPTIVKALIELLHSEIYNDPLFPGYGLAPELAAQCLGKIGDKSAIIALFEDIGEGDFFHEERVLTALTQIGEPAKAFLLKVVQSRPITYDNERAALALAIFKHDRDIRDACLKQLEDPGVLASLPLATHLVLACEGTQDPHQRQKLLALSKNPKLPKSLRRDIELILQAE